nr:MAG TPA: hypothetical protein [Crassvirales sp.]
MMELLTPNIQLHLFLLKVILQRKMVLRTLHLSNILKTLQMIRYN